jgi:hypothetical protein
MKSRPSTLSAAFFPNLAWNSPCVDTNPVESRSIRPVDNETLTITDNRTQKSYTVPIFGGTVRAMDLRQIKTGPDDFGLMTYDPAFMNTAACHSAITYLDGDKGILRYRGYPIEQLAGHCTFLEVAYLLLHRELPAQDELDAWNARVMRHTMIHENIKKFMDRFHHDAHPMGSPHGHPSQRRGCSLHVLPGCAPCARPEGSHEQRWRRRRTCVRFAGETGRRHQTART